MKFNIIYWFYYDYYRVIPSFHLLDLFKCYSKIKWYNWIYTGHLYLYKQSVLSIELLVSASSDIFSRHVWVFMVFMVFYVFFLKQHPFISKGDCCLISTDISEKADMKARSFLRWLMWHAPSSWWHLTHTGVLITCCGGSRSTQSPVAIVITITFIPTADRSARLAAASQSPPHSAPLPDTLGSGTQGR